MDGQAIAAIIGASTGLVLGLTGSIFAYIKFSRKYKNSSMKDNYQTLYAELRKEIGRLRDEQIEERRQWAEERKAFNSKIDKLQELVRTQDATIHQKDIQVTQLNGRVELLQSQLETYREAYSQTKKVTVNA